MKISVELFGQLSLASPRRQTLELADGATIGEAAAILRLEVEEIGLITMNGVQSEIQDALTPNCRLCFFPHISGG